MECFSTYKTWNYYRKKYINGVEFKEQVEKLSNKYIFPYSEVHLKDLAISDKEDYIKEDLTFIEKISKNHSLGFIENEKIIIQQNYINIADFFDGIRKSAKEELNQILDLNFETNNSYNISINEMNNDDLLKPFIEQNNGVLDNQVFGKLLVKMYQEIDNSDYYKKFRIQVHQLKKKFDEHSNTLLNQESTYYRELIPFLNFIIENDINEMKKDFQKTMIAFLNIDKKRKFENLTVGAEIELVYSLLDYNEHFRDKINKKNRPTNMFRDIKYLHFVLMLNTI